MDPDRSGENTAFDSGLLAQMARVDSDAAGAEKAWEEFYRRHYDYLFKVGRGLYARQIGEGPVFEAVQEVFVKAFRRASTFEACNSESADEHRRHVRAWLGSILRNTVSDLYRQEPEEVFIEDLESIPDPKQGVYDSDEEPPMGPLEKAFTELEENEREVLRETMLWHNPRAQQQRMPSAALQALATRLNTTPTNIRQIRSRAIAKLKRVTGDK